MKTVRLTSGDTTLAKALFTLLAAVFEEREGELGDEYVAGLLARPEFWAIAGDPSPVTFFTFEPS
jgi:hypothetical protein